MPPSCPECNDAEEIVVCGLSVNPYSGVPVHDPQKEDIVPCWRCTRARDLDAPAGSVGRMVARIETDLRREAA